MHKLNKATIAFGLLSLSLGCVINDDGEGDTEATGGATTGGMTTAGMTTAGMTMTTTAGMTMDDTAGTADDTAGTADDTAGTADDTAGSTSTGMDPGPFVPDDPDPAAYTRVDRMGMPAVNTALISCTDPDAGDCAKNDYNNASPQDDLADTFIPEFSAAIAFLHGGLDAELSNDPADPLEPGLGLVPCPTTTACRQQVEPLVLPDTIKLDTTLPAGFPNGRTLPDQVIDITLAVLLLDLVPPPDQSVTTFADVPVNPDANDAAFGDSFPFLAASN